MILDLLRAAAVVGGMMAAAFLAVRLDEAIVANQVPAPARHAGPGAHGSRCAVCRTANK